MPVSVYQRKTPPLLRNVVARKVDIRRVGARRVGPKNSRFSPLTPQMSLSLLSLESFRAMVAAVHGHGPTKVTVWASLSCSALIGLANLAVAVHLQKYWFKPQFQLFATVSRIDNGRC